MAFGDQAKALGAAWKALSDEEKEPWRAAQADDKKRHDGEMRSYTPVDAKTKTPKKAKAASATKTANNKAASRVSRRKVLVTDDEAEDESFCDGVEADSDEGVSSGLSRVDSKAIPRLSNLPALGDIDCGLYEPRSRIGMREERFQVDDEIAWIPQAFLEFLGAHDEELGTEYADLPVPMRDSMLVQRPADGTAHAAVITAIRETSVPGLTILELQATPALQRTSSATGSKRRRLDESGVDSCISEGEGDTDSGSLSPIYSLPQYARPHCDVDPHVVHLEHYMTALADAAAAPPGMYQVAVPFAASDTLDRPRPQEELWEGRAFNSRFVWQPEAYPRSRYKSLHVVWYRQCKRSAAKNPLGMKWVFDDEQTDNHVSPWDALPSKAHGLWTKAFPKLASISRPRTKRGVFSPNAIVEAPESMVIDGPSAMDGDDEHGYIAKAMKRLLSNEAVPFFYHPVPLSLTDYHDSVAKPICLHDISEAVETHGYASYRAFHSDVETMVSNAFLYNADDSTGWIMACMFQNDVDELQRELTAAGLARLLDE